MEKGTIECKICNKGGLKNLATHVRTAHGMSMEDYNKTFIEATSEDNVIEVTTIEDVKDIKKVVSEEEKVELLDDFLKEYKISKGEVIALIKNFQTGESIPVTQVIKRNENIGKQGSEDLKDRNYVETTNLHIAENLTKEHGFVVIKVGTDGGKHPKTWYLKKE